VGKNGIFEMPFITLKNEHFTKTGSGQTWENSKRRDRLSLGDPEDAAQRSEQVRKRLLCVIFVVLLLVVAL
jgi:hypothetical protein